MIPKYKLTKPSYVDGVLYAAFADGSDVIVAYDGNPGTNMVPTDEEGRRRQDAYFRSKGITAADAVRRARVLTEGAADVEGALDDEETRKKKQAGPVVDHVAIPEAWADLNAKDSVDLAAKLGAPVETTTKAAAQDWVRSVVEARAKAKG